MNFEVGDIVRINNNSLFHGRYFTVEKIEENWEESCETGEVVGGPDLIWGSEDNGWHHVVCADELELIWRQVLN